MNVPADTYTIAVDAMGGDDSPAQPVRGAVLAARRHGYRLLVVGATDNVRAELERLDTRGLNVEVVGAEGVVAEGESPLRALQAKPRASVAVAADLVRSGQAQAMVSMGSTGATMAAAVLALGTFPGLDRPALGGPFIALAPRTTIMDLGAQIDCRPSQLLSFGALGSTFARLFLHISAPRVALLSVGSEESKGNRQVQDAFPLFRTSGLNFIGNIEGHDLFLDRADVVVCDGFVGNILLKFTEGLAAAAARLLGSALGDHAPTASQLQGLAASAEAAGGPLFGVNGTVVIGHGRSSADGVAGAIHRAAEVVRSGLVQAMREDLAQVRRQANVESPLWDG